MTAIEQIASIRYDIFPYNIRAAYKGTSVVPRLIFLYIWLFGILIARERRMLPDNGWVVAIILVPFIVWLTLTYRSYSKKIAAYMSSPNSAGIKQ